MASEMTQRQRAEVVAEQICDAVNTTAYPSGTITRLVWNALQEARQEALREAAERLGVGDSNGLLAAPCLWCGYNGEGYYQAGTHGQSCPWNTIGGCDERLDRLAREGREG